MLVTVTGVMGAAGPAQAMRRRCAAPRGAVYYAVESEQARCSVALDVARVHERSHRRRGACDMWRTAFCRVRRYGCVYRVGWRRRARDVWVVCNRTADDKLQFVYDARKLRLPAHPPSRGPQPDPELVSPPAA